MALEFEADHVMPKFLLVCILQEIYFVQVLLGFLQVLLST